MKSFHALVEEAAPGFWRRMGRAAADGFAKGWGTDAGGRLRKPWPFRGRLGTWAAEKWAEIRAKQRQASAPPPPVGSAGVPAHGLLDYPSWQHGLTPTYNAAADYGRDGDADYLNIRRGVESHLANAGVGGVGEDTLDFVARQVMGEIEALRDPRQFLDKVIRHLRGA